MTDEINQLVQIGVATIYEAAGRVGLVDLPLVRLIDGSRAAGRARIAACAQDDNRAVHAAVAASQEGDVLVLSMPEPRPIALLGELLATQARVRGVSAVLVDAAVRDRDELVALGLPVWTRFLRATGATKRARGELDVPVVVGKVKIEPGDVVVLDGDGAVSIPAGRVSETLTAAKRRLEREMELRRRFSAGELSYDIYGFRDEDVQVAGPTSRGGRL